MRRGCGTVMAFMEPPELDPGNHGFWSICMAIWLFQSCAGFGMTEEQRCIADIHINGHAYSISKNIRSAATRGRSGIFKENIPPQRPGRPDLDLVGSAARPCAIHFPVPHQKY